MLVNLPKDNIEAARMQRHVEAFVQGYLYENIYPQNFENGTSASRVLYADTDLIKATLFKEWRTMDRSCCLDHIVTVCFNRAGLEQRLLKDGEQISKWMKCLEDISYKPMKCLEEEILSNTATAAAVQGLQDILKDKSNLRNNLYLYSEEVSQQVKKRYGLSS